MSRVSQEHVTDVILHLQDKRKNVHARGFNISIQLIYSTFEIKRYKIILVTMFKRMAE